MLVMRRRQVAAATMSKEKNHKIKEHQTMDPVGVYPQMKPYTSSLSKSSSKHQLDLQVINDAFGKHSDLYEDVLHVASSATQEEIQLAYFDRRSELFTLLAKIDAKPQSDAMVNQRYKAERKMDAVVLAVRVLGSSSLRAAYDRVRPERLREPAAMTPQWFSRRNLSSPRLVTPTAAAAVIGSGFDDGYSEMYDTSELEETQSVEVGVDTLPPVRSPTNTRSQRRETNKEIRETKRETSRKTSIKSSKSHKTKRDANVNSNGLTKTSSKDTDSTEVMSEGDDGVAVRHSSQQKIKNLIEDNLSVAMESRQEDDTLAADTMDTVSTTEKEAVRKSSGVFSCFSGSRVLRKLSDEISGAFEDTLVSVDQVFNAFTLTDKDIKAVTKKIHKAKRQLDN